MFCIIIETVVINISRNQQKYAVPHSMSKILLSVFLKMFLCLPDIKVSIDLFINCIQIMLFQSSKEYGNLNTLKSKENQQTMWIFMGVVIDRIAFFVYLGLIVYALCITY